MMRNIKYVLAIVSMVALGMNVNAQGKTKYKCMIQLNNYTGPAAYIIVSLMNESNGYEKTLYVLGSDKKWYPDLKAWHKAFKNKTNDINAITGASVTGGDRTVVTLEIDNAKMNSGYKIRFETAVEHNPYYEADAEVLLTTEGLAAKTEGKGYIRYVRFSAN